MRDLSWITTVPTAELRRELRRRSAKLNRLIQTRRSLLAELNRVESLLSASDSVVVLVMRDGRRRSLNKISLVKMLQHVIGGKEMGVAEAAEAVVRAGYQSVAARFQHQVSVRLANSGKFIRLGHGRYTAK